MMWIDLDLLSKQQRRKIEYIVKDIDMAKIKVKLLNENCMPERTHRWDAGWDLKSTEQVVIPAGETVKIHTGAIFEIPPRNCGMVVPRSSLGTKFRVTLANDVGIIDSEYRGEILVFLSNDGEEDYTVNKWDRFAQIVILPINSAELWPVDNVSVTGRGDGGFGSTTEPVNNLKDANVVAEEFAEADQLQEILEALVNEKKTSTGTTTTKKEKVANADDLTETEKRADAEAERSRKINELRKVKASEYVKMKNDGTLFEKYPIATGDMKEDLGL